MGDHEAPTGCTILGMSVRRRVRSIRPAEVVAPYRPVEAIVDRAVDARNTAGGSGTSTTCRPCLGRVERGAVFAQVGDG